MGICTELTWRCLMRGGRCRACSADRLCLLSLQAADTIPCPFSHEAFRQSAMGGFLSRSGQSGSPADSFLRYGVRVWLHLALGWGCRSLQYFSGRTSRLSLVRPWNRRRYGGHVGNRRLPGAAGLADPEKNRSSCSGLCGRRVDPASGRAVFCLADAPAGVVARICHRVAG